MIEKWNTKEAGKFYDNFYDVIKQASSTIMNVWGASMDTIVQLDDQVGTLTKKNLELENELKKKISFEQFGREFLRWYTEHDSGIYHIDGFELWEIVTEGMVKNNLAERVKYDPKKHGDMEDVEEGDEIVWWGDNIK